MLSEKAEKIIEMMKGQWENRPRQEEEKDEKLAAIAGIYAERALVDDPKRIRKLPDKISVAPQMADGVYGEWLRYSDHLPGKLSDRVILFLHGGGFQTGSCLSRREMAARIGVYARMDTFIINYRLAPEYQFPAALDDCVTAFLWLLKQGYHPEKITVIGESAGANLCLCMSHYLRDHYLPLPGKIVPFSPVVDLLETFESEITNLPKDAMMGRSITQEEIQELLEKRKNGTLKRKRSFYVTEEEAGSIYASPIRGDFSVFPKMLIEVGRDEILYDHAVLLYQKAKEQGADVRIHVWEGLFHVFALFDMPETEEVSEEIAAFAREEMVPVRPEELLVDESSPLKGKRILFLGSSVTYGFRSGGKSFVEGLCRTDGIIAVKEAVSGTVMVEEATEEGESFITRMKKLDQKQKADCFVCQLSTNDAGRKKPLGVIAPGREMESFDTHTITGAIEYIIAYVKNTWGCPVVFYTSPYFGYAEYGAMVDRLHELQEKWEISVIDFWNDPRMRAVSEEEYRLYMADPVHPTMAGYSLWLLPEIRAQLIRILA